MTQSPRRSRIVTLLIVLELFLALGAFGGAAGMIAAPDGSAMELPLDMLENSPFSTYLIPGVILALCNGVFPLVVAIAALRRQRWARYGHLAVGCILTGWIAIQGVLIGFGHWLQIAYLALGLVLAALGLSVLISARGQKNHGERTGG